MAELDRIQVGAPGMSGAPDRSSTGYPVLFCDDAAAMIGELVAGLTPPACVVIADATVARLHAAAVLTRIADAGVQPHLLEFPPGEASKSRATWAELTDRMLECGMGRDAVVVALGGGVTCDLAGFVAATYMRGVPLVQVPTTMLAMVDASIGAKTAVDVPAGKNLVGAFHAPAAVVIDPGLLATLPRALVADGLVEALKHGAISDADYFARIVDAVHAIPSDTGLTRRLIRQSVAIKADVVSRDPLEQADRAVLNFGHSIGHGLEHAAGYRCGHGVAVARGMVLEARLGEALGVTRVGTSERLEQAVVALDLPAVDAPADAVLQAMRRDKKNRNASVRTVLISEIGSIARASDGGWTHAVPDEVLERLLAQPASPRRV